MKQEEYLDQLLNMQHASKNRLSVDNDEIAASLAAAEMLTSRLQQIDVPADVTRRLERSIRVHARSHFQTQQNEQTLSHESVIPITRHRSSARTRPVPKHRAWVALLGVAAILVLAFAGLLTHSTHNFPGAVLSNPTHVAHRLTPTGVSNPQDHACPDIVLLQSALADLRTAVNHQRGDEAIKLALKTVAARTKDCQDAVAALPAGSEHNTAQQNLATVLTEEEQTVRQLLTYLDWSMQLRFTQQLGVLGDPVPTIANVAVHLQSNGTFLITLTGTHFASQARLMFNGRPDGIVSQPTLAGQLVAIIHISQGFPDAHAFGILNPDGTAAQLAFTGEDDHNGSGTSTPSSDT